jgi:hypothetical protein
MFKNKLTKAERGLKVMAFNNTKAAIREAITALASAVLFSGRERIRTDDAMVFFSKHVRSTLEEISKKLQDLVNLINSKTS